MEVTDQDLHTFQGPHIQYTYFQDPVLNNEAAGWMGQLMFVNWKFFIHHCFHKFGLKQHPICWAPVAFCGE